MTQPEIDELLETIAERSHELCDMIQVIQAIEGATPSDAWLLIFNEITKAWFNNDVHRLHEINDFIIFGRVPKQIHFSDLDRMILGPGPLTNN